MAPCISRHAFHESLKLLTRPRKHNQCVDVACVCAVSNVAIPPVGRVCWGIFQAIVYDVFPGVGRVFAEKEGNTAACCILGRWPFVVGTAEAMKHFVDEFPIRDLNSCCNVRPHRHRINGRLYAKQVQPQKSEYFVLGLLKGAAFCRRLTGRQSLLSSWKRIVLCAAQEVQRRQMPIKSMLFAS